MKLQLTKRACPTCKEPLDLKIFTFSIQNELVQCPKCKSLVRRKIMWIGPIVYFLGGVLTAYLNDRFGYFSIWCIAILGIAFLVPFFTQKYEVIKRDFKIRNKITNQVTYISHAEWQEIVKIANGREPNFEIVEDLR